jgi:Domain of unknown function (DUF4333)
VTDHQNFANRVIAASLAVIAACAVVVTIEVNTGISVKQQPVLNPAALRQQVTDDLSSDGGEAIKGVDCPLYVVVKVGSTFECQYGDDNGGGIATVKITSDQGAIDVEDNDH